MLSGGAQRRTLARHQSKEMKILNILFPQAVIEPTTCRIYSHLSHSWPQIKNE